MRLGVVGLLPSDPRAIDEATARQIRGAGFTGVSVVFRSGAAPTDDELAQIRSVLAGAGLRVAQVNAAYEGLVSPDEARRRAGVRVLQESCRWARRLGATNTYVRPGSLNPRGPWLPHPANTRPETIDRLIRSLREVAPVAEGEGVRLAVEGHVTSPLETPERVRDVFEAVGSPALGFNADPVNFVGTLADAYATTDLIDRLFDLLGKHVVCAHVKDVAVEERLVVHIAECVPGDGLLDLATFLRRFDAACPDGYALIEHLPAASIPRARQAIEEVAASAGLTWRE